MGRVLQWAGGSATPQMKEKYQWSQQRSVSENAKRKRAEAFCFPDQRKEQQRTEGDSRKQRPHGSSGGHANEQ